MNGEVREFLNEFERVGKSIWNFLNMARAKEFQLDACRELTQLLEKARALKLDAIRATDEDSANAMLSIEHRIYAVLNEFGMWIALKDGDPNSAWNCLVTAQESTHTAMLAHPVSANIDDYADRLDVLEHFLFPNQMFVSPGMVIGRSDCSICGQEYGDCEHVEGRVYMGKMCWPIRKELKQAREVSLVDLPVNKRCRAEIVKDGAVNRNYMTWATVSEAQPGSADMTVCILTNGDGSLKATLKKYNLSG
jgi:hypothetical protein